MWYPLLLADFSQNWKVSANFSKTSKIAFQENLFSGSRLVTCGPTDTAKHRLVSSQQHFENKSSTRR
jgi:hypothetical protein